VTYTYDDNDKLTAASGGGQSASFTYDNDGNMASVSGTMFGSWLLGYDDEDRLTSVEYPFGGGNVTDSYQYNGQGQRYRASLNGTWHRYWYDGDRILEELDDSGSTLAQYTAAGGTFFGPWLHMWRSDGGSRFPLLDGVGSARGLVDGSATLTDSYRLDSFGTPTGPAQATLNPYRFGAAWGYITDPSGMLQLGARFYWPEVGRFVSQDPLHADDSTYAYAEDNPVVRVDATGKWWLCYVICIPSGFAYANCVDACNAAHDIYELSKCPAKDREKQKKRYKKCWDLVNDQDSDSQEECEQCCREKFPKMGQQRQCTAGCTNGQPAGE